MSGRMQAVAPLMVARFFRNLSVEKAAEKRRARSSILPRRDQSMSVAKHERSSLTPGYDFFSPASGGISTYTFRTDRMKCLLIRCVQADGP